MDFGSGFVLAVLAAAVLLSDRFGGDEELGRRLLQVAVGFTLALLVLSVTTTFVLNEANFNGLPAEDRTSNRIMIAAAIQGGSGVLATLIGLAGLRTMNTIPLGLVLGGVLSLIASGGEFSPLSPYADTGSFGVNAVYCATAAAAFGLLVWFAYDRYERSREPAMDLDAAGEDLQA